MNKCFDNIRVGDYVDVSIVNSHGIIYWYGKSKQDAELKRFKVIEEGYISGFPLYFIYYKNSNKRKYITIESDIYYFGFKASSSRTFEISISDPIFVWKIIKGKK